MERLILLFSCSASFGCAETAHSDELAQIEDPGLVHLLNNMEIVEDRQDLPVAVRIVRLRELGECDGPAPSCPSEVLYVAVSTFDEAPDQILFALPESYGWQFVQWASWPSSDDVSEYASFEVTGRVLVAEGTVVERRYVVRVNKRGGTITAENPE
jgi:hypothetical protein